ncbi:oxidoreductase [Providencia alcalifaciens]|uniref:NADH:flavin oxidoreductase/NADH oxidase n=1 Tax=Providencia alcalifaciens TaxID=126385 RepID=UPI0012B55DC1|nr:NADH:flavin oxidoreductase/NADH oxidase [Providencia alcalifaciens]MTC32517.1 oxidoreductase [Providencia alcalifaciens]
MSYLFSPANLGQVQLANRIVVPPMCQYSAHDGLISPWHQAHYMNLALSGASLVIVEASAVTPSGRITYKDLGLWNEQQMREFKTLLTNIKTFANAKFGIQIAHAGRKAACALPWEGGQNLAPDHEYGWQTVAPSALAFGDSYPPKALTVDEIHEITQQFVDSAKRAEQAGFELIEIHAAHGYLLHEFLSPIANQRQDEYGGSFANRTRFLVDVFREIRAAVSPHIAVGIRISATDWVEGGWDLPQSIKLTEILEEFGCDYIHVSSGGLSDKQQIPVSPNYQVPLAQEIHEHTDMPVIAVGLITEPHQAEAIIATGQADFIAIGRGILYEPRWPWRAASVLNEQISVAPQYLRCAPHQFKQLFK